jgi:transposase InsO family protein
MVKIRSDNGSEFRNTRVEEYCDGEGIKHEFSSTYTPKQNGVVERKNKTLITLARAMLDDYVVSKGFGRKLSTRHVMLQIECISTNY